MGNPNFAIVDEAYPYIARRLLTDKSPRMRAALRWVKPKEYKHSRGYGGGDMAQEIFDREILDSKIFDREIFDRGERGGWE